MGACSTITVSRNKALAYLMQNLFLAADAQLEEMLDIFLRERLYNASICDDANDDDMLVLI